LTHELIYDTMDLQSGELRLIITDVAKPTMQSACIKVLASN
jgi:hypothetical protein